MYGCEVYHCLDVDNNPNKDRFHLVLIATNQEGLTNLYEIVSHAGMHVIHGRTKDFPVTDLKFMSQHGKGIIALTACVAGIVPQCIINGQDKDALMYIDELDNVFDDVYLEVQPHDFAEQLLVNSKVRQMPKEIFEDLKNYYKKFNSLAQAGALRVNLVGDVEDEKIKKIK